MSSETEPRTVEAGGLRPVLGFLGATSISLGGIIGSGIFLILGIAAGEAGPAVILSILMAGVVATFTAVSFASLGAKITKEGGEYQFVYQMLGKKIGFLGGLLWLFSTAIAAVTVSIAFSSYLSVLVPLPGLNLTAALVCLSFMLLDITGIRTSAWASNLLVILKVGALALFIIIGLPFVRLDNFQPFFAKGTGGILSATFLVFFAYAGFGKIAAASEEVKNPAKNVPRAIIVSVAACAILYLITSLTAVGVVGADRLSSPQYSGAPLAYVMLSTGFHAAFFLVTLGALAATASVLLVQMLGLSRTVYAMSINRQVPPFLSLLHLRFRTPYRAELLIGSFMAVTALFLSTSSVVGITSTGILSYYALINLAALRLQQGKKITIRHLVSLLGLLSCAGLVTFYLLPI